MWGMFFVAYLVGCILLFLPGFMLLGSTRLDKLVCICCAPLVSTVLYCVLGIVYGGAGITTSALVLVAPIIVCTCSIFCLHKLYSHVRGKKNKFALVHQKNDWILFVIYAIAGFLLVTFVFVKELDGPGSFIQEYDNWSHLGGVQMFLDTGVFSSFRTSLYHLSETDVASPFIEGGGFYPSAWQTIVAFVVSICHVPVTVGTNAVNALLIGTVCPLSMYVLLKTLFPHDRLVVASGVLLVLACTSFPWDFVIFGPLYPNLMSYAMLPAVIAVFIVLVKKSDISLLLRDGILFVIGCCAIVFTQPNGIFTAALFLAPFCVHEVYTRAIEHGVTRRQARGAGCITVFVIFVIWMLFYNAPALAILTRFVWPKTVNIYQACADVVLFSMTSHPVQLLLTAFIIIGIVKITSQPRMRWIIVSYVLMSLGYVLSVATEGELKHIVGGFWYTDSHRLAANVGLVAVVIAAVGLASVGQFCIARFVAYRTRVAPTQHTRKRGIAIVGIVVVLIFVYYPSFDVKGLGRLTTAFGDLRDTIHVQNDTKVSNVLDEKKQAFLRQVKETVPTDASIINSPNDGSGFAYGLYDMRMYYRQFSVPENPEKETPESQLIRLQLNTISSNSQVREAVKKTGLRYVVLLDQGHPDRDEERRYFTVYSPHDWEGIQSIKDDTPGFRTVLKQDDMRLYEILP